MLFLSSLTLRVCDVWSLQYFRFIVPPLCLSTKLTNIHIELFSLATAIYPITCILMELHARNYRIIHILWKPISIPLKKLNITSISVTSDAVIHTFATFILLSSVYLTYILTTLWSRVSVFRSTDGTLYKHVMYYDPTTIWLSSKSITYIVTGIIVFIFLLFIPSLYTTVCVSYKDLSQYINNWPSQSLLKLSKTASKMA